MYRSLSSKQALEVLFIILQRSALIGLLSNLQAIKSKHLKLLFSCLQLSGNKIENKIIFFSPDRENYKNNPVELTFEIPYFTVSGI